MFELAHENVESHIVCVYLPKSTERLDPLQRPHLPQGFHPLRRSDLLPGLDRCKGWTLCKSWIRCKGMTCCRAWTRCKDYDLLQVLVQFALRDALSDMLDFRYFCTVHYFFVISMAPWSSAARPGCIPLERREAVRASMYRAAVASIETLDSAAAQ